jgi:hypothetical protein
MQRKKGIDQGHEDARRILLIEVCRDDEEVDDEDDDGEEVGGD